MSKLICPACNSAYAIESVRDLQRFPCSICKQIIIVPMSTPGAPAAKPQPRAVVDIHGAETAYGPMQPRAPTPPSAPAAPKPSGRSRARKRLAAAAAADASAKKPIPWVWIVTGVAVLGIGVVAAEMFGGGAPKPPEPPPVVATAAPAPAPAPKADPMHDPGAWKALTADQRAMRTDEYFSRLDRSSGDKLFEASSFFRLRNETAAVHRVAELELMRDPTSSWARDARGDVRMLERIESELGQHQKADDLDTPAVQKLARLRRLNEPKQGTWWVEAKEVEEYDKLFEQLKKEDEELANPAKFAVAKWAVYQRKIEVMKDHPAIHGTVGPYVIFVQIKAPLETPIDQVEPMEMNRAERVLHQNQTLFRAFYDGFLRIMGPLCDLKTYGEDDVDEKTILKANIFADESTWKLYHQRLELAPYLYGIRAYYNQQEPRFIVTYDSGAEPAAYVDQVQCHEAVHQLLHFFTWDVTRKAEGRELTWAECDTRPMWLDEGFAEFFSSHRRDGTGYTWMQPLDTRMEEMWAFHQAMAKKGWAQWSLDEMLSIADQGQLVEHAVMRAMPKDSERVSEKQIADAKVAARVLPSVFYGRAWSLTYFLWNKTDAAGAPKYRAWFIDFLKRSLHVRFEDVPGMGPQPIRLTLADFRKAMGLVSESAYRAFEREWMAWETDTLAAAKRPSWDAMRTRAFELLGVR